MIGYLLGGRTLLVTAMFPAFLTLAGCGASFLEGTIAPPNSSAWMKCGAATKVRVKPPHSTVTVAYTEPTTGTDGKPLTNLAHTTIYYNAGDGPVIGKVVTRTALWEHVWESDAVPDSNVVDVYVRYLRNKLGREPDLIRTIRGGGYVLEVPDPPADAGAERRP